MRQAPLVVPLHAGKAGKFLKKLYTKASKAIEADVGAFEISHPSMASTSSFPSHRHGSSAELHSEDPDSHGHGKLRVRLRNCWLHRPAPQ